ncbi:protein-export membrane protein SecD [Nanobdella aerobiophila]|uniref:Protein-export membrane protein SecD n=1 Tax=Nanobdella aerobiophila TaxID=2586965 RepID=A0A915WSL7_9ARCH|nr:hypothetical protein [Nanobdella aerobiophila]BBL45445.1 protein-export membrane protein SecD [Nanobdella aerobiophila]
MNIKSFLKDWRILLFFIILLVALFYDIYSILSNKIEVVESNVLPNQTYIYSINNCNINSVSSYYSCIYSNINDSLMNIKTSKGTFVLEPYEYNYLINYTNITEYTNIEYGTDIAGGYLLILNSTKQLTPQETSLAAQVISNRLNSFGVKSINIYPTSEGYIIVEIPYSEGYLIPYIIEQGTFYAKVGNYTVFTGSDVKPLFGGSYSGLLGCSPSGNQYICQYYFTLILNTNAAENFAQATQNLSVILEDGGAYLNEPITFYLDNQNVSSLLIAANLKGQVEQEVSIQVSGVGSSELQAENNAYNAAQNLYIILENGQLPAKFNIVQESEIPPIFGFYILGSLEYAAVLIFIGILVILYAIYRKIKVPLLISLTLASEFIISFAIGIAIHQTYDISAFIGIIFGTTTGIDDQLVATEEILRAKPQNNLDKAINKAMFIILLAIILEILSVFPAFIAGLALYKGFAVMVIITVGIGYLLTRPAFINIAKKLL